MLEFVCVGVCACVRTFVRVCVLDFACAGLCVCVRTFVRACVYVCWIACVRASVRP